MTKREMWPTVGPCWPPSARKIEPLSIKVLKVRQHLHGADGRAKLVIKQERKTDVFIFTAPSTAQKLSSFVAGLTGTYEYHA